MRKRCSVLITQPDRSLHLPLAAGLSGSSCQPSARTDIRRRRSDYGIEVVCIRIQHCDISSIRITSATAITFCLLQLDSVDVHANRAHVLTSDGGRVTVALKSASFDSAFVEFEGIVDAPNQLREEARCEFGSSFGKSHF